ASFGKPRELRSQLLRDRGVSRIRDQVFQLMRVVRVIVKKRTLLSFVPLRVSPALGADGAAGNLIGAGRTRVIAGKGVGRPIPGGGWIAQQWTQARAFQAAPCREPAQIGQRRINVDRLHDSLADATVGWTGRNGDQQRDASADFKERAVLGPFTLFPEMIAVIAPEHD